MQLLREELNQLWDEEEKCIYIFFFLYMRTVIELNKPSLICN